MQLEITNLNAEVLEERYLSSLKRSLTTYAPGYRYSKLYKLKKWDGKVCLLKDKQFPTGLIPRLNLNSNITDNRFIKSIKLSCPTISLRDYQFQVVKQAFENKYKGLWWPRGVIKVATGGGKTHIAAAMIEMTKVPTLFLANNKQLVTQTKAKFESLGLKTNTLSDPGPLVITTVQSLMSWAFNRKQISENLINKADRMIDYLKTVEQIFVDEAHGIASSLEKGNLFTQALNLMPNAYMRWGLTATPFMRAEYHNLLLEATTGNLLSDISTQYLIERGYLVKPEIFIHSTEKLKIPREWPECYLLGIVHNEQRNKKIAQLIKEENGPILVLVKNIAHGKIIEDYTKNLNINIEFINGEEDNIEEREKVIRKLQSGKLKAVISTRILDQGIDIPELRTLILAGAGKSISTLIQQLGRALRPASGKSTVHVHDFLDHATHKLYEHSLKRQKTWESENHSIKVV